MDFADKLRELSARIPRLQEQGSVKTEEGAKNALIMPFINALGYNVFDPLEVTPELVADVGTKKGEKVDYAILRDGEPIIIFECKGFGVDLSAVHTSQLYRYFSVTPVRFGVLTNGIIYKFYSDLESVNRMDEKPFFIFDLSEVTDADVEALKQFTKSHFDQENVANLASELKYKGAIRKFIAEQFNQPSEDFIRLCLKDVYSGRFTQTAIETFTPITKEALWSFVNTRVNMRLKSALVPEESDTEQAVVESESMVTSESTEESTEETIEESKKSNVVTTEEEINAYLTVKAIVREIIDVKRVIMRDAQSYCSVLIDDNNRKNLCRLRFNTSNKVIGILDADKNEVTYPIETLDDIYNYADQLKERAQFFIEE